MAEQRRRASPGFAAGSAVALALAFGLVEWLALSRSRLGDRLQRLRRPPDPGLH